MPVRHLVLASTPRPSVGSSFSPARRGATVAVVPTAADALDDRETIVDDLIDALAAAGWSPTMADLTGDADGALDAIAAGDGLAIGGGDPFHLLAVLRATGADDIVAARVRAGTPFLGVSAGAIVAGPSLAPMVITSPFPPPAGLDVGGRGFDALGIVPVVVLPHHDRPGRASRHAVALRRHGRQLRLQCLGDGDQAMVDGDDVVVHSTGGGRWRSAVPDDADAVAAVYDDAARAAWAAFIGDDRLAGFRSPPARWRERIVELTAVGTCTVGEDGHGIAAFASGRPAPDDDLGGAVGELALLYASPRCWGTGLARRLHAQVLQDLLAGGHDEAVVWTEERNDRALAFYRRAGWEADGASRARTFLDVPIVERRLRLDLAEAVARS